MVRMGGFEPPRREARAPQARVSTVPPHSQKVKDAIILVHLIDFA